MNSPKVGFVSLGCPKALVDSERILTQLRTDGYEISPSYDNADVVVVSYGITSRVALRGIELAREKGINVGHVQMKIVWPLPEKLWSMEW